jgi:hypothetical protein
MVGDSVIIYFPRKRSLSVSTTRMIRPQDREAKKVRSLKYFEVYGVQEKEPVSTNKLILVSINLIVTVIFLKQKKRYQSLV